jgi:hypothetical protein
MISDTIKYDSNGKIIVPTVINPKKELIIIRDKHILNIYNSQTGDTLRYDLIAKKMYKFYKRENQWRPVINQYAFFRAFSIQDITCEEKQFMDLILVVKTLNPKCRSISSFISRLEEALAYENYAREGLKAECYVPTHRYSGSRAVLTKPLEFYHKKIIAFFKKYEIEVTKQIEEEFVRDYKFMEDTINTLEQIEMENSDKADCLQTIVNETENLKVLINEFKYETKSLIRYFCEYLQPFENLKFDGDSIELLVDYYRMANMIGREVKKYPKYLKSMHDIILANYTSFKKEYDELLFERLRKIDLEFEGKEYCIITPKCSKELIAEGTSNNNCVASYIPRILRGETYLFFMRLTKEKERSLITLEYRNGEIIQAKGSYNRLLNESERKFLESYCKNKQINLKIGG